MHVDEHLSGFTTGPWQEISTELAAADFARKIVIRYVVLPNYDERVRFRVIRNDGRPSLLVGMSLEQFNDCSKHELGGVIRDAADTYLRGYCRPLSPEKQRALGQLLSDTWKEWGPIVFSILPPDQLEMNVIEIIEDLSRHLDGAVQDEEVAEFLRFSGLDDIRQAIKPFFPDDSYPVTRT